MQANTITTFSVILPYGPWVGETNTTGADLLLSYFEDVMSEMPIEAGATACRMEESPNLMFTFRTLVDALMCQQEIERTWQTAWLVPND